jgi:hypothetical protein
MATITGKDARVTFNGIPIGTIERAWVTRSVKACLEECIHSHLNWVEMVRVDEQPDRVVVAVAHSYPEGINISPWVIPIVVEHVTGVRFDILYQRVDPPPPVR